MPAVSVVIAAHNPGDLLERSLGSVLSQTFADFECLVIDDASTEDISGTPGMDDPRVRHIRLPRNRRVAVVLNTGVWHARADHVAFLAHDDEWLPTKLERQMAAVQQRPDAPFCYTEFEWVFPDGQMKPDIQGQVTYPGMLSNQMVSFCSLLMSRETYITTGGLSGLMAWAEDFDFLLRVLDGNPPPVLVPEVLTRYYLHGANHSSNYRASIAFRRRLIKLHREKAMRDGRMDIVAACDAGLRRSRELYGAQAFDRARLARRNGENAKVAIELTHTAISRPSILVGAISHWLRHA